jgi:hypothetical protein
LVPIANDKPKERNMQRLFTMTAAATMLFGANMVATTAKAEFNYGPVKNGNLCFTKATGWSRTGYGSWGACPVPAQPAAVAHHHNAASQHHHVKHG